MHVLNLNRLKNRRQHSIANHQPAMLVRG